MTYPVYTPLRGGGNLSFGGDEFIFVEVSPEMDIEQALCIQALAKNIAAMDAPGIIDICPSHASYMLRFDPEVLDLETFLPALEDAHEQALSAGAPTLSTEIVDIPVYYNDPWTRETLLRFRDRHQDPDSVDIEYVARVNGYEGIQGLIDAHSDNPFLATFPNFTPGNAECVQLAPRELQIQAPKYERPRTYTPSRALGHGGNCSNIYPSAGAGGFQLLGRSPVEILDMSQTHPDYADSPVLFRAGTVISFRAIDEAEYFEIRAAMEDGTYRIRRAPIEFSVERHLADWRAYNLELKEALR